MSILHPYGATVATRAQLSAIGDSVVTRLGKLFSMEQVDRKRLTNTINQLYALAEKPQPVILFLDNPPQMCALAALLTILATSGSSIKTWKEFENLIPRSWWRDLVAILRKQTTLGALLASIRVHPEAVQKRLSPTRTISLFPQYLFQSELIDGFQARIRSFLLPELTRLCAPQTIARVDRRDADNLNLRVNWLRLQMRAHLRLTSLPGDFPTGQQLTNQVVESFARMPRKSDRLSHERVEDEAPHLVRMEFENVWWGAMECASLLPYLAALEVCGLKPSSKEMEQAIDLAENILKDGHALMFIDGLCLASSRPDQLRLDDQRRLHSEHQPALSYAGGYSIYSYRGVSVPSDIIRDRSLLTVKRIQDDNNSARRRVFIEMYGQTRYLLDSGAEPVQQDEVGVLYRQNISNDEAMVMVKVINSSPEPDGTYKEYYIRVPPSIVTAREAVAWTFGLQPERYNLAVET